MDAKCRDLDDVKAALEKLTIEYRAKTELSERLRRTHDEQLVKIKEAKLEIEKQAQELNAKEDEISVMREKYEDLKSTLLEKESSIRHLSSSNEKIRSDYGEKLQKLEVENRELAFSLDEANIRAKDQKQKIHTFKEEIEGLKGLLSVSQKKCFEAEQRAQAPKELRQRDDLLMKQEDENLKIKDQLKWKKEQFTHLEEAHKKVQDEFQVSKKAWEKEKSTLVDKICSLQSSLDSQTRTLENLRHQLQMCNQALAHEESRRRLLEVQMSESKTCYENVCAEYQEAKSKIESLTDQRDEEIATLRNLLGTKEKFFQEMEFRNGRLEQENRELRESLKELQEAQIQEAGAATSLKKLRNKLRGLEQVHKDCSRNLKARENEWNCKVEKMMEDLHDCRSKIDFKDKQIQDLQMELEGCRSSIMQLKVENEEMSVILMMFKSGVSDSQSKLSNSEVEMELGNTEAEEQISLLMEQLEQKNNDLVKAHAEIEQEREMAALLMKKIKSSDLIEQQHFLMQKELERYKEMLEEASGQQHRLKEQALHTESSLKEDLQKISDALDKVNSELTEKTHEGNEIELELYIWKSVAERLQSCLDENQKLRKEMEVSLLAQVEIEQMLEQDKENLLRAVEEKDERVCDLHQTIFLLEEEIVGKQTEINEIHEAWEKITTAVVLGELEIQGKSLLILELEDEINKLHKKLELQEESLSHLKKWAEELEATLEAKQLEMVKATDQLQDKLRTSEDLVGKLVSEKRIEELEATLGRKQLEMMDQLQNKPSTSEGLVDKLESEKRLLLEDIVKLSSEKEDLLAVIWRFHCQINEFSNEDTELMGKLGKIMRSFTKDDELRVVLEGDGELYDSDRENVNISLSSSAKKVEANPDGRSPLKERNNRVAVM